jgi:hypothetical protein
VGAWLGGWAGGWLSGEAEWGGKVGRQGAEANRRGQAGQNRPDKNEAATTDVRMWRQWAEEPKRYRPQRRNEAVRAVGIIDAR